MKQKITLLEQDLESAEERADEATRAKTEAEHQLEEATRENAKLRRDIEQLESMQVGKSIISILVKQSEGVGKLSNVGYLYTA